MKIKMLRSSVDQEKFQFAASYVINDTVAIDAGCIGLCPLKQQKRIRHVVLSHSHLDHICSLPLLLDNVYSPGPECPIVHGHADVIDCLQRNFFNEQVWPDVMRLSREESPFVEFVKLVHTQAVEMDGLRITPVALNHVVSCFGFVVEDDHSAIAIVSDTGPTDEIWTVARRCGHLRTVFIESAFPNSHAWLAERAGHLTPNLLLAEYRKLGRDVPVVVIHIKPRFYHQVVGELEQLGLPNLTIGEPNLEYEF